jgi:hypothetical protein
VAHAAHVIHDLIDRRVHEPHELDFGHRFQSLCCHADADAGDHVFGERGVLHAVRAEAFQQADRGAKYPAALADVLA